MAPIKFIKPELVQLFKNQLSSIEDMCDLFDQGKEYISQDIAVKIRVIFHNTNNSKSLIQQLKLDHVMMVCSSNKYDPKNLLKPFQGLASMRSSEDGWTFAPLLRNFGDRRQLVSQENWWNSKKILVDKSDRSYTRSKLVKYLANKDGGAHIDPSVEQEYFDLTRLDGSGWGTCDVEGNVTGYMNPVPASIRQMAFEVLETFKSIDIDKESKLYYKP